MEKVKSRKLKHQKKVWKKSSRNSGEVAKICKQNHTNELNKLNFKW